MGSRRLLWQLFPTYVLFTLAALVAVGWYAVHLVEQVYVDSVAENLRLAAELAAEQIAPGVDGEDSDAIASVCDSVAALSAARLTVVGTDGVVIYDTERDAAVMDNHGARPEFAAALDGRAGAATRYSTTMDDRLMYVAVPLARDGGYDGAVRASISVIVVDQMRREVEAKIAVGGLFVVALAAVTSLWVSRRISRPLEEMRQGAERFARGELGYKLPSPRNAELAGLSQALNSMAGQLEERINTIVRQHDEQEAVLASMVEGVFAVDVDRRVISMNEAAARLLQCDRSETQGRELEEVVRNVELRRFVVRALSSRESIEGDVLLNSDGQERILRVRGTALRASRSPSAGALVVVNDVTRLRQLENMRTDFAANVSHELKTPITSIKGFVETLLDGAMRQPDDAERFLRIVDKQTDRLNAIIDDLLSLARIEQGAAAAEILIESALVPPVLESALADCADKAAERQIDVAIRCPRDLRASMNPALLAQAVTNLLDNAIKYSDPAGKVAIDAERQGGEIVITVRDTGCGIPQEHLARVFERFYRVDKARSRKLGGTGLGLAIVKHIVNANRGRITVTSKPGSGSTFTIFLRPA